MSARRALAVTACFAFAMIGDSLPGLSLRSAISAAPAFLNPAPLRSTPLFSGAGAAAPVACSFSAGDIPPEALRDLDSPPGYEYWRTVTAKVTAYDPSYRCCGDSADGRTSIMDDAWIMDGVAVDPRAIPYRTLLLVPGVGFREADDTGSAMRQSWERESVYHIDVRMPYFEQAREWGVKYLQIKLYRKAETE
ncbi:MAG: 3D domain-containing protein [Planctomycetes bacterium]|nr:3D domain-containing protein [Planctomycetota bacterium]